MTTAKKKKPWGGRFDELTDLLVETFTESVSFDWRLYPHDIAGSIAHARMLGKVGVLTRTEAAKIVAGLGACARTSSRAACAGTRRSRTCT
jgi:argininosuccinate lyase